VAIDARHTYALAKNGLLPRFVMQVDKRFGIPNRALALNLAVIVVFLLPFGGWQNIVSVMGDMYLLIYASSAVAATVFRVSSADRLSGWVPGLRWISPLAFVVSTEFVYWSGWHNLRLALPLVLAGLPLFLFLRRDARSRPLATELRDGAWLVVYLAVLIPLSWLGGFKGSGHLHAPWDSAAVAVFALAVFRWAVGAGVRHLAADPAAGRAPAAS
jgi:amino acid transporter